MSPTSVDSRQGGAGGTPAAPWGLRATVTGIGILSLLGYAVGTPVVAGRGAGAFEPYVVLCLGLFLLYLLAVTATVRRPSADRVVVGIILGFALLFRLAVLPTPIFLSSDPYRYLWDGHVQWSGYNPYRYAPADDALRSLRDAEIYPNINRSRWPTVYPPGAEIAFAIVARLAPDSILGWRLFIFGCEAATGGLLLGLLRRMGVPGSAVVVYAWAPLTIFEGVQAGHVDFAMLPLLLLALSWRQTGRLSRAGAALGLAVLIKLYPAILLLAWRRRGDRTFPAACAGVVLAGYGLYLSGVGRGVVGFLPRYFSSAEDFNIGLRAFVGQAIGLAMGDPGRAALGRLVIRLMQTAGYVDPARPIEQLLSAAEEAALRQALDMPSAEIGQVLLLQLGTEMVRGVLMLVFFALLGIVLLRIGQRRNRGHLGVFQAGMAAVAAYLVLVPTAMHAWYAVWIVPFLTVYRSPAWLWFTGVIPLSYLKYAWEPAAVPLWLRSVEFLPLYALLVWEWRTGRWASGPRERAEDEEGLSNGRRVTERGAA